MQIIVVWFGIIISIDIGIKIMSLMGSTMKRFLYEWHEVWFINNLNNYFGLIITGDQVYKLDQIV